jgi:hypothetical protein
VPLIAFIGGGNEMNDHFPDHEALQRDLEKVLGVASEPSDELRASVLDYAAPKSVRRAPRPWWRQPAAAGLAAAAVLTLLVLRPDSPQSPMVHGDLNGDGRVDILDAWRLSRVLEGDPGGQDAGDLDADGEITPGDLDRLMQQIVAVGGGRS